MPRQGDDFAGDGAVNRGLLLADDLEQRADVFLGAGGGVLDGHAGLEGAGDDADVAELADEGVDGRAPDLRHERGGGVGLDLVAFGIGEGTATGGGEEAADAVEHLGDAVALERVDRVDGVDRAGGDRVAESAANLFGGERAFLEVLVHELLGALGGRLGERGEGLLKLGGDLGHVEDVGDRAAGGDRQRAAAVAEVLADGGDGVVEVGVFLVEARDGEGDGLDAMRLADVPGAQRAGLNARGGVDDDEGRVGGRDGAADLPVEAGGAGGVDEDEAVFLAVAGLVSGQEGVGEDRGLAGLLLVVRVGDAGAVVDGAKTVIEAKFECERIGQRGLAAAVVPQNRKVSNVRYRYGAHVLSLLVGNVEWLVAREIRENVH